LRATAARSKLHSSVPVHFHQANQEKSACLPPTKHFFGEANTEAKSVDVSVQWACGGMSSLSPGVHTLIAARCIVNPALCKVKKWIYSRHNGAMQVL
jgi:hypothetical protein